MADTEDQDGPARIDHVLQSASERILVVQHLVDEPTVASAAGHQTHTITDCARNGSVPLMSITPTCLAGRSHMLDEVELASWLQQAPDMRERCRTVLDLTHHLPGNPRE
eukprot:3931634-Rhodomonas_salina.1